MEPVRSSSDPVGDQLLLRELFLDAECAQFEANRRAARQSEHLADVLDFARAHPELYVNTDFDPRLGGKTPPLGGDATLAERCAVLEASSRLHISEGEVRASAAVAQQARQELPRVWAAARDGLISLPHVKAVLAQMPAFEREAAAIDGFDQLMRDVAVCSTVGSTRRQAREVADRLTACNGLSVMRRLSPVAPSMSRMSRTACRGCTRWSRQSVPTRSIASFH